ncbi:methyltransferase domain-containing protein [Chloroflexota bacterium]|nr:methyltransferase domain-containing protein [Chloroflexota bacterium]
MSIKPIFSHFQTRLLARPEELGPFQGSLDLGMSQITLQRVNEGYLLPDGQLLTDEQVLKINEDENGCFILEDNKLRKVEFFSAFTNRYYSLMPTESAPTMLISGIPMHRIKGTNPMEDTRQKLKALGRANGLVLDTTTGLGYTAILAAQTAKQVITIEFDPTVIEVCRANPWSQELFSNPRIQQLIGDSGDLAPTFADDTFNAIVHDPPTFNLAGHLYSGSLYATFHRILKSNGKLFHYIGNPESRYGATTGRGVVNRLRKAGFTVSPRDQAFGVLAQKMGW